MRKGVIPLPLLIFSAPLILAALYGALDFVAAQQIFDQVNQLRTPVENPRWFKPAGVAKMT